MAKSVYPVYSGPYVQHVPGVPAVPHLDIPDKEAARLVATGAFTYDEPPPTAAAKPTPTDPADAGSSDSKEA